MAETAAHQKLAGLQALRGLAALAVVVHHTLEELGAGPAWLTRLGACGVDVFFVISGFIMFYTSAELRPGEFMLRRFLRIAPVYWICTLAVVALSATGAFYKSQTITAGDLIGSLLFVDPHPVLGVGWTLHFEMYFYLLFGLTIATGLFRWSVVVIPLLLGGIAILARGTPYADPIVFEFAFGIALAAGYRAGWLSGKWSIPAALAACAAFCMASLGGTAETSGLPSAMRWWAWGVPAALAIYAALWWRPRFTLLGDASYSVYLVHPFVMTGYAVFLRHVHAPALLTGPAAVIASVALGLAFYRLVEDRISRATSRLARGGVIGWLRSRRFGHPGTA